MSISTTIPASSSPTDVSDLWAMAYLFKANWTTNNITHSTFQTVVTQSRNAGEVRRGLMSVPRLTSSGELIATGRSEVNRLISMLKRTSRCRSLFPLYSDQTELSVSTASGASVIGCDTTNRRLFAGNRIVIVRAERTPGVSAFNVRTISSLTSNSITLDTATDINLLAGDFIFPLFEARLFYNFKASVVTDRTASIKVDAVESTGDMQVGYITQPGTLPSGFSTYNDLPIFEVDVDFSQSIALSISQYGQLVNIGIDTIPTVYGDRPVESFDLPITAHDRATAFKYLSFWQSRGGKLFPFYAASPLTEFTPLTLAVGADSLDIVAEGEEIDWSMRPLLAFVLKDGTTVIREITDVSRTGAVDTLSFDAVEDLTLAMVERVATGRLCRFNVDEQIETWQTVNVMQTVFSLIELLNEEDVTVEDLTLLTSSDLVVDTAVRCIDGMTAGDTYYQATLCDGTLVDVWLLNTGQTLPYEFKIVDDPEGDICYKIPVTAFPQHVPGTIPAAIIQGTCCAGNDAFFPECYELTGTSLTSLASFQSHFDQRAELLGAGTFDTSGDDIDGAVNWLIDYCGAFVDRSTVSTGSSDESDGFGLAWTDVTFKAAAGITGSSGWTLADVANGLRQLLYTSSTISKSDQHGYHANEIDPSDFATAKADAIAAWTDTGLSGNEVSWNSVWGAGYQVEIAGVSHKYYVSRSFPFDADITFGIYTRSVYDSRGYGTPVPPDTDTFDANGTGVSQDTWNNVGYKTVTAGASNPTTSTFGSTALPAEADDPVEPSGHLRGFGITSGKSVIRWHFTCVH